MDLKPVPFRSPLFAYEQQAESLLARHAAGDPAAIDLFHRKHPRFLDEKIKWRPKFIPDSEIRDAILSLDDASQSPAFTISLTGLHSPPTSKPSRGKALSSNSNRLSKPW